MLRPAQAKPSACFFRSYRKDQHTLQNIPQEDYLEPQFLNLYRLKNSLNLFCHKRIWLLKCVFFKSKTGFRNFFDILTSLRPMISKLLIAELISFNLCWFPVANRIFEPSLINLILQI